MNVEYKTVPALRLLVSRHETTLAQLPSLAGSVVPGMMEVLGRAGFRMAGPATWRYFNCLGEPEQVFTVEVGLVVAALEGGESTVEVAPYELLEVPEFRCAALEHHGGMENVGESYAQLYRTLHRSGARHTAESREVYHRWIGSDSPHNLTEVQVGLL